jgi:LCP family protein required for cell wall assembly
MSDMTGAGPSAGASASPSPGASAGPSVDASAGPAGGQDGDQPQGSHPRKRRPWRIALIAICSLLALAIAAAAGGYAYVNHLASGIPRIKVTNLAQATSSAETILVTANPFGPTGRSGQSTSRPAYSELFMLLHINANGRAGGAVTIPADTIVNVPGHGAQPLWYADKVGGPSLVVKTITGATGIPINHYARIDFNHVATLVDAIGGVTITIPETSTAFGQTFHKGANFLTGVLAVYYARDPSLNDEDRTLRQEVIVRTALAKIGDDHLLTNPLTLVSVLKAITSALTVDSNLTNSDVMSLATELRGLTGSAATFVTAPTQTVNGKLVLNTAIGGQLRTAVQKDDIAGFAKQYPKAVTPLVVP